MAQTLEVFVGCRYDQCRNNLQNKMAAPEASVHLVKNRLCYHFAVHPTNKSCSQRCSRRIMLLRSLKSCLRVTAPNVTEVRNMNMHEWTPCTHMHMPIHMHTPAHTCTHLEHILLHKNNQYMYSLFPVFPLAYSIPQQLARTQYDRKCTAKNQY